MQTADLLKEYAAMNLWANRRMADWLSPMPEDLLLTELKSSFPTILKTIKHITSAEDVWRQRLIGKDPTSLDYWVKDWSREEVFANYIESTEALHDLIAAADEAWLDTPQTYVTMAGLKYDSHRRYACQHVLNHSTYHRGQLVTMGRSLGLTDPPSTDFLFWKRSV